MDGAKERMLVQGSKAGFRLRWQNLYKKNLRNKLHNNKKRLTMNIIMKTKKNQKQHNNKHRHLTQVQVSNSHNKHKIM